MSGHDGTGVQRRYAPNSICFGCGPANMNGLQISSFRWENGLEARFSPSLHHQAFPGMVNGGIIGTLLDCHGNWSAAMALMEMDALTHPPCTVTAQYSIRLKRPTPVDVDLLIRSEVTGVDGKKVNVNMWIEANGQICAEGDGLFVAVREGHPAYHRWE